VFEFFTESARQVVVSANQAAVDLNHGQIDTEHELLGLLADPNGIPSQVLNSLGVTAELAREQVIWIIRPGEVTVQGHIPLTPAAKRVLELSLRESLSSGTRNVAPEHVLLALVRENAGVATQVLLNLGAEPAAIRDALIALLPARGDAGPQIPRAFQPPPQFVTSNPVLRRVLNASMKRALDEDRSDFGIADLLIALTADEDGARAIAMLGVDVDALRDALKRDRPHEPPTERAEPVVRAGRGDLFERFTDQAGEVVDLARLEAKAFEHDRVGPEHLLLGLLRAQHGIAAQALDSLGITVETARARIVDRVPPRKPGDPISEPLASSAPFTPRAKRLFELSLREALSLGQASRSIGPEHILLSIARDNENLAMGILRDLGVDSAQIRETVLGLIPNWRPVPGAPVTPLEPPPQGDAPS
jgi:ATP-dependent Clp protease ATP-binding subunit ClpA